MSRRSWIGFGALLLVGAAGILLALAADGSAGAEGSAEVVPAADVGTSNWLEIPARLDVPFERLDGSEVTLRSHAGRVVLLNFWGTWCPPCRREIPELVALQAALPEDVGVVIGVAIQSGSPQEIRKFAREFSINYPLWIGDSQVALANYTAVGYPYTLLIDAGGTIRRQYLGPQSYETLASDVEALTGRSLPAAEDRAGG